MYKISFYVPLSSSEIVKEAMFATGAGKIGNYDKCCWETLGTGQFRALQGSQPAIGKQDVLEKLKELKIEMVCDEKSIMMALNALKTSHPYEEPAYACWKIETFSPS